MFSDPRIPHLSLEVMQEPTEDTPAIDQITLLEIPVEWMRFCDKCGEDRRFYADRMCVGGLVGKCSGCGNEFVARWTRTTTEVA